VPDFKERVSFIDLTRMEVPQLIDRLAKLPAHSVNTLVLQIINGKFEIIWPLDAASASFVFPQ
jgi:hypothetical protein